MELLPAIDLRDGRCVRLRQGDYAEETVYGDDPVAQALAFAAAGARWVHVVDLDAALSGAPLNRPVIAAVTSALAGRGVLTQTGGGVRSIDDALALAGAGVRRVVLGTAAVVEPDLIDAVAAAAPGLDIALGLDVRGREVAMRGWTEEAGDLATVLARYEDRPVDALVVTQIAVDGTGEGPDLALYRELLAGPFATRLVASGGVGIVEHLAALRELDVPAVIVGRALYEGAFTVEEALAACASPV
ncbi:MAG: 1-(5-phosphoribosyl)-5-[(5-phosphoribosylamino)methylideneamino] imidazole-4-carboxamide isomerase [Acidimicrobiia bacterium]|nr:1-(5-phosphoribosyl)-5-[(5-phosphoribosylamino)methylideneamino] imidazole-4-carboxamide isomerase [Acidimicrobiia bacterium]